MTHIKQEQHLQHKKIAIVHDFLLYPGGAERVLRTLADMYPDAPIYTLLYDKECMRGMFEDADVHTSFLQKLPRFLRKRHRWLLPFFATAVETYDLREFDIVISSSSAWSKGLVTRLNTQHIAYIHSPMRYVWDENERYVAQLRGKKRGFLARQLLSYLRVWDYQAAQRPDLLIANSEYTKKRIKKFYRREASVVYPSVTNNLQLTTNNKNPKPKIQNAKQFQNSKYKTQNTSVATSVATPSPLPTTNCQLPTTRPYFLIVSRLSAYKNVELAIDTCNRLELPLVVVGEGEQREHLEKIAGETVSIVGWQSDDVLATYYIGARALLFPCDDDFGLTMIEALRHGTPVIALHKGGAKEIVEAGVTGEFFDAPVVEVFADALRRFIEKEGSYDKEAIKRSVERFSSRQFQEGISRCLDRKA